MLFHDIEIVLWIVSVWHEHWQDKFIFGLLFKKALTVKKKKKKKKKKKEKKKSSS